MIVVGLTGSIGMGKSATAEVFREFGVPVHDSDAAVHDLYAPGAAATAPIEAAFPGVLDEEGGVDRGELRDRVLGEAEAMKQLEAIVHPLVGQAKDDFMKRCRTDGAPIVVLDIPLLFETGGEKKVDYVVVVSAPPEVQKQRVLERPGMTEEMFNAILSKQAPDSLKREKADYIIDTSKGFDHARAEVRRIIDTLLDKQAD